MPVFFVVLLIITSLASKESIPLKYDGILLVVLRIPDRFWQNIVVPSFFWEVLERIPVTSLYTCS
jgi:hypothetical protein